LGLQKNQSGSTASAWGEEGPRIGKSLRRRRMRGEGKGKKKG